MASPRPPRLCPLPRPCPRQTVNACLLRHRYTTQAPSPSFSGNKFATLSGGAAAPAALPAPAAVPLADYQRVFTSSSIFNTCPLVFRFSGNKFATLSGGAAASAALPTPAAVPAAAALRAAPTAVAHQVRMSINASKKKRAHWQSKSIRGKRTWKCDSNSRHLPQAPAHSGLGAMAAVGLLFALVAAFVRRRTNARKEEQGEYLPQEDEDALV